MHLQTHVMSGWCVANCFRLSARERFLAMLAAGLPDLDGVTYFFGDEAYWATHHIYGHNLLFALLLSGVLVVFCAQVKLFPVFSAVASAFHDHLLGSGEGGPSRTVAVQGDEYAWNFGWV